jgi:preprotein translocase subunit SecB
MTASKNLPIAGYRLDEIVATKQSHELVAASDDYPPMDEADLSFGWDWRITDDSAIEVLFSVRIAPTRERHEVISVAFVANLRVEGETQSIDLEKFVRFNAPGMLMPFVREAVASLTARGPFGTLYLPPMNIVSMMMDMDPNDTIGARQLRDSPDILQRVLPQRSISGPQPVTNVER